MNPILTAALQYQRRGWSVIPLKYKSKEPAIGSWREFQTRRATVQEITGWFSGGNINIGVVTGQISGLVVVDLDGKEGINEARRLGLSSGCVCLTGGNGKHFFYSYPETAVGNSVRRYPGIDLRGNGGYVVAAPSVHESGRTYRWLNPFFGPLGKFPAHLFAPDERSGSSNNPGWIGEALEGLQEGSRNNTFTKIVGRLHRDGWKPSDIKALLASHAEKAEFPGDELDIIIASITSRPRGIGSNVGQGLLSADKLMATPKVNWLIQGAVPERTTTIIGGLQGIGKSWVLLDTALELTREMSLTVFGKGQGGKKVLYFDEENGENLLADRLRLLLANKPDCSLDRIKFAVDQRMSLSDTAGYTRFVNYVKETEPEVVFIDSLIQIHSANENDAPAMTEVLNKLRAVRDEFNLTVFLLHHESKSVYSKEDENKDPTAGDLRGSNAIAASVESVFTLRKREGLLSLYHTKARFSEALVPRIINLANAGNGVSLKVDYQQ